MRNNVARPPPLDSKFHRPVPSHEENIVEMLNRPSARLEICEGGEPIALPLNEMVPLGRNFRPIVGSPDAKSKAKSLSREQLQLRFTAGAPLQVALNKVGRSTSALQRQGNDIEAVPVETSIGHGDKLWLLSNSELTDFSYELHLVIEGAPEPQISDPAATIPPLTSSKIGAGATERAADAGGVAAMDSEPLPATEDSEPDLAVLSLPWSAPTWSNATVTVTIKVVGKLLHVRACDGLELRGTGPKGVQSPWSRLPAVATLSAAIGPHRWYDDKWQLSLGTGPKRRQLTMAGRAETQGFDVEVEVELAQLASRNDSPPRDGGTGRNMLERLLARAAALREREAALALRNASEEDAVRCLFAQGSALVEEVQRERTAQLATFLPVLKAKWQRLHELEKEAAVRKSARTASAARNPK